MVSWIFFGVSVWGALFTLAAVRPPQRPRWLGVPVFFAGWLTGELALHHIVWQALATAGFVFAGALDAWPGRVGLAVTLASWAGLVLSLRTSHAAHHVLERSLRDALGPDYRERLFYISGPQAMVKNLRQMLLRLGVRRSRIKVDFFPGFA
jgi:transposase InsO family protein